MDWAKLEFNHLYETLRSLANGGLDKWHFAGLWPVVALLVGSVILGLYGERLTRVLILAVFVAIAAALGQHAAGWLVLPFWPTVIFAGALGGIFSFVLYRYALGLVLAVTLAGVCGAWSAGINLERQEISGLLADLQAPKLTAQTPEAAVPSPLSFDYMGQLERLWQQAQDLRQAIAAKPGGQKHLLIMMLAGAAVGMLAGLVLGRIAAMLWTSVLGGAGLIAALADLAIRARPEWADWMSDNRQYILGAVGMLALVFFARQATRRAAAPAAAVEVAASPTKS